jgi:hypothetical protein
VKDLPDLALLATVRALDGHALRAAIDRTFEHRATHAVPSALADPPEGWAPAYAQMAIRNGLAWPDLESVLAAARAFLDPLLSGGAGTWQPSGWCWR